MYPIYLESYHNGKLDSISEEIFAMLSSCTICPRKCKVNRLKDKKGFCRTGLKPKVYSFMAHHGEEPPVSGRRGSGTIFFSGCNMACAYCQNYEFSQLGGGREIEIEALADFMLQLQEAGCHNINLVTPTHCLPQILKALSLAIPKGLKIPLVYNTSGYELPEIIKLLDGIVDIYLADMRYADNAQAIKYSRAPDYPKFNQASLKEMHRQVGIAQMDEQAIIERGLIIRHLALPDDISGTDKIMRFIARELSADSYISLMSQYSPYYKAEEFPGIARRITRQEYLDAKAAMEKYGLYNGWTQDAHGLERFAGVNIKPI
ncbi:MAG: radical SAM protein [Candidatus Omnitrophica bacterium]|nr:radical SAM protein [Candidatus Omnitrophota bacterium]MDD5591710.1 radical SAM protein [Candidatus Omnitrophota bacterium]